MKNDLLTIGGLTVHGYGLMIGIGFIAAYLMTEYRARKYKMNTDIVFSLFLSSVVFGLLGAKLMYYLTILDQIIKDPGVIVDQRDGFVVYGGDHRRCYCRICGLQSEEGAFLEIF